MQYSPGSLGTDAQARRTARAFGDLTGEVVNATVSQAPLRAIEIEGGEFEVFVAHVPGRVPVPMLLENGHYLYLYHRLGLRRPERYLATLEYVYRYQADASDDSWIFRYEYQREPQPPYEYPLSHVHVNATPASYGGAKPFDRLHLPAGERVTIESVARHLVEEHGVGPISPNWRETLARREADWKAIQRRRALSSDE